MCVSMFMFILCMDTRRKYQSPWNCSCEQLDLDAGAGTYVLCKRSKGSEPLRWLSFSLRLRRCLDSWLWPFPPCLLCSKLNPQFFQPFLPLWCNHQFLAMPTSEQDLSHQLWPGQSHIWWVCPTEDPMLLRAQSGAWLSQLASSKLRHAWLSQVCVCSLHIHLRLTWPQRCFMWQQ